jgi:hypothetical protein
MSERVHVNMNPPIWAMDTLTNAQTTILRRTYPRRANLSKVCQPEPPYS